MDLKGFFNLSHKEHKEFNHVEHVDHVEGDVLTQRRRDAECAEHDGELPSADGGLHLLYLGRRHPLKGVEYLEQAVAELNSNPVNPVNPVQNSSTCSTRSTRLTTSALSASPRLCVRFVSNAFGEEKERVWDWCDVLVLPTLSDNFGLVIAEALERGKRVITTDGAPAWGEGLSRVERVEGLTQRRRDAECAEMFSRVERVEGGLWSGYEGRLIYLKGYRDGRDEERVELLKKAIDMLKHDGNMV